MKGSDSPSQRLVHLRGIEANNMSTNAMTYAHEHQEYHEPEKPSNGERRWKFKEVN